MPASFENLGGKCQVCNLEVRIDKASSCLFDADFVKREYESTFHGT